MRKGGWRERFVISLLIFNALCLGTKAPVSALGRPHLGLRPGQAESEEEGRGRDEGARGQRETFKLAVRPTADLKHRDRQEAQGEGLDGQGAGARGRATAWTQLLGSRGHVGEGRGVGRERGRQLGDLID